MKKKYLMNGLAVMAVGLFAASCSKDVELSKTDIVSNAESALGVKIAANQDWNMINNVTARVTVNLGTGEDYTLYVYDKSPFDNNDAVYFTKQTVKDASITEVSLSLPSYLKEVYVSVFDSRNHSYSRSIAVSGNYIFPVFGTAMESSFTRSQTDPEVLTMSAPYDEAWVAEYLKTAKEPNSTNVNDDYNNSVYHEAVDSTWVVTKGSYYVQPTEKWVVDVEGHNETITTRKWVEGKDWGWDWNGNPAYTFAYQTGYDWFKWSNYDAADVTFWQTYCQPYMNQNWAFYGADNKKDATTRLIQLLRENNRGSWANVWAEGSSGGYQDVTETKWIPEQGHKETIEGYWTEEEGYWTEPKEAYWEYDETYVTNFKITGTWDGNIRVAASEGSTYPGCERTIVVTGTWNLTESQTIGSLGKVIVANGGTINISNEKNLTLVNQAQLVVLHGGTIEGAGNIVVTNGNADGYGNYNGGTINLTGTFNNNFGKFYNYGTLDVANYASGGSGQGAQTNGFFNHGIAVIGNANDQICRNARIYNACQFYVKGDIQVYILEVVQGASFIVDGELRCNGGYDGSNDPNYVALGAGALIKAGSLFNNGSSFEGPTSNGYAVLSLGSIVHLNWPQDHPEQGGYFANNIYVHVDDWTTIPSGNGIGGETADQKFAKVQNKSGNGNVTIVDTGDYEVIPADADFVLGEKGCTPGFKIKEIDDPDPDLVERNDPPYESSPQIYTYAFEDTYMGDYDLNDVVLKVWEENSKLKIQLCASGASKSLYVYYNDSPLFQGAEVHSLLGAPAGKFVNTGVTDGEKFYSGTPATTEIDIPEGFDFSTAGFNIRWGNKTEAESIWLTTRSDSPIGVAPYAVCIPADWEWPLEWVKVSDAYTGFSSYAANPSSNEEWYKSPTEGKTY